MGFMGSPPGARQRCAVGGDLPAALTCVASSAPRVENTSVYQLRTKVYQRAPTTSSALSSPRVADTNVYQLRTTGHPHTTNNILQPISAMSRGHQSLPVAHHIPSTRRAATNTQPRVSSTPSQPSAADTSVYQLRATICQHTTNNISHTLGQDSGYNSFSCGTYQPLHHATPLHIVTIAGVERSGCGTVGA
jgi:hypothetical protein